MRDLNQHARAVACQGIGANRSAMLQVLQDLQRVGNDLMRLAPRHVGNEADAACVVFVSGIVKPLGLRAPGCSDKRGFTLRYLALRHIAISMARGSL